MSSFLTELKRRNVVRVAVVYSIVGWLLVEVASVILPTFKAPEWIMQVFTLLVILGFPLALIFAWAFEITPGGLKRTHEVPLEQSITRTTGRALDFIIIGILSVAVVYLVAVNYVFREEAVTVLSERPSIAVLPFSNRSADPENAFFAEGIHDDVLTRLAKIGSLKVISRTSVARYKNTNKSIPQIAEELGVAAIMEGAVQRAGNMVRINVQLIDAGTDEHLWAEAYNRRLTTENIFAIQNEIATAIADALRMTLTPEEQAGLRSVPTDNLDAYIAYLQGKQSIARRTSASLEAAIEHFRQASELDPNYALAYVGLADAYGLLNIYGNLSRAERLDKSGRAIKKALELDSQLGEAYASLGYLKSEEGHFEEAAQAFRRALDLKPNYATTYHWYGNLLSFTLGRPQEGLALHQQALELDPLSTIINLIVGFDFEALGRFNEAREQYLRVIKIDPAFPGTYEGLADLYWKGFGKVDEAVQWLHQAVELDPGRSALTSRLGLAYLDLGDVETAQYWIDRAIVTAPEQAAPNVSRAILNFYLNRETKAQEYAEKVLGIAPSHNDALTILGIADLVTGRYIEAQDRYLKAFPALLTDENMSIDGSNYWPAINLALVLQKTGDQDRAKLLLEKSLAFIETIPRLGDWGYWSADFEIHALQGKVEQALATMEDAVQKGWRYRWWFAERNPNLDSIRNQPEFQAMMDMIRADMAAQLARVQEMEARGELEPIPEPVSQ